MAGTGIINNPILRFPEFNDGKGWVISSIGELFDSLPTASYSRAFLIETGSIGYIHYGDIHTKFNTFIDISKDQLPFIPADLKKRYHLVKDGDLVLTDASEDYTGIGKAVEIINVGKRKAICGLHTILLRGSKQVFYTGFKTYLFQSPRVKKQIERLSVGFKVNSISFNTIKNIQLSYPNNKTEQEKIIKCLHSIETIISSCEKEIDILTEHKKALLQKTLPQNCRSIPLIRYPKFIKDNNWMTLTLKDIAIRITEKVGDRNITPVSISAGEGFISQVKRFGRDISGEQYKNYIVLHTGDFAYNKGNSIKYPQGCIYALTQNGLIAVPSVFICFRLKKKYAYCKNYIQWLFENNYHGMQLQKHISSSVRNNGLLNINVSDFFNLQMAIPTNETECKKIEGLLSSVDNIIKTSRKKIDLLEKQKQGLLQKLFPNISI